MCIFLEKREDRKEIIGPYHLIGVALESSSGANLFSQKHGEIIFLWHFDEPFRKWMKLLSSKNLFLAKLFFLQSVILSGRIHHHRCVWEGRLTRMPGVVNTKFQFDIVSENSRQRLFRRDRAKIIISDSHTHITSFKGWIFNVCVPP